MTEDNDLIGKLVERLCKEEKVPSKQNGVRLNKEQLEKIQIFQKNAEALENVAKVQLENVLLKLAEKLQESKEEMQIAILEIMDKCLCQTWDKVKAQQSPQDSSKDYIPDSLATKLHAVSLPFLLKAPQLKGSEDLPIITQKAGRVLFHVSALNADAVFPKVASIIEKGVEMKDNDDTTNQFNLLQYLDLNTKRLANLLALVHKNIQAYAKKPSHQIILTRVLRKAIWNWIDSYPMEFVALCKSGQRFSGNPDQLFDIFLEWSTKQKVILPLLTMLLILCPDIMLSLAKQEKNDGLSSKERFMDGLRKSLKDRKTSDISAMCFVDICKASTYVAKSDVSALRFIVPAIESDLTERLFDPKNPYKNPEGEVDMNIMIDCLVSLYRLNPRKVTGTLIADFLKPDTPWYFKQVLVKSLQIIVNEGNSLPWNPPIAEAYQAITNPLRSLFQEYIRSALQFENATDKKLKQQFQQDLLILPNLLSLYLSDPVVAVFATVRLRLNLQLILKGASAQQDLENTKNIMTGITDILAKFTLPEFSDLAAEVLIQYHKPKNIEKWCAKNVMQGFWEIGSSVLTSLANILLVKDIKGIQVIKVISILEEILTSRNEFLNQKQAANIPKNLELRTISTTKLETSLLLHLSSADPDISSKAATCLGLLCDEIDILGAEHGNVLFANYGVYKKLASSGVLSTGRVAQQLAIRKLLRKVERSTNGNYAAWTEIYQRWEMYTPVVLSYEEINPADPNQLNKKKSTKELVPPKQLQDKSQTEIQDDWKNFTGFLVAMAAVCLNKETTAAPDPKLKTKVPTQTQKIKVIDSFIDELLDLVVAENKYVRETIMSLTGTSISHAVYPVLFRQLYVRLKNSFGDSGQVNVNAKNILLVDQSIAIVKHVIELQQDPDNLSLLSDFEILMETFVKFVSGLIVDELSLKIKKTTCLLVGSMMEKRQFISFRNEFKFRNNLVENIIEWTSDFAKPQVLADMKKQFSDLDVEAMKALASLLRGLPLGEKNDDQNAIEQKNARFGKCFKFFTKLLSRAKEESKSPGQTEKGSLAEFTIQCLSNLLAANIESGLKYFVTMGYHEDYATRTAFLKVITNILSQGAEFDNQGEVGDKYDKLVELILEGDLNVILALGETVQVTEQDDVALLFVRIFEANDRIMQLLKSGIESEISKTTSSATLFRRNSVSTKLLSAYSKINGRKYLKDMLTPTLQSLYSQSSLTFEIDPTKVPTGQDLDANVANVMKVTEQFLDAIIKSVEYCPSQFREICHILQKAVSEKFPGFENAAVGGFLFLRFICPAIVSPEGFGIVQEIPSQELRRGLILVTKTLQSIANNVQYEQNKKEPYMGSLTKFIEEHAKVMSEVFAKFATIPTNAPQVPTITFTDEQREGDLGLLHHYITVNLEKIGRTLQSGDQKQRPTTFERLTGILQKLGPAPEPNSTRSEAARVTSVTTKGDKGDNSLYEDFMKSKASLNTDKIKEKQIFYKHGVSKEKYPVFYLIARRYIDSEVDMDTLLYYILKTVQGSIGKPFVLVIDCTLFGPENFLPISWGSYFKQHFPVGIEDNIDKIIVLNPNREFKRYSKNLKKLVGRIQLKKLIFLSNALKISDYIADNENGLPPDTLSIEKDVKASFSPVLRISQVQQKETVLRVSTTFLQLLPTKQDQILGKNATLIDLIHVATIKEISQTAEEFEFIVKYGSAGENKSLVLRSPAAKQIIERLNASKNLHKITNTVPVGRSLRNPSDVPGSLLNMALLNLGIFESEQLRLAAYNMLHSICMNFKFNVAVQLLNSTGLSVPTTSFHFVVTTSEKLATSQPNLTLEFLLECLQGLTAAQASAQLKHLCLDYMRPWIPNLARFYKTTNDPESSEKAAKTRQLISQLIDFTIKETSLVSLILTTVWETMGTVSEVLETVLDCCIEQGIKQGNGSPGLDVIGSIVSTMAAQNSQLISGKVISRLLSIISSSSKSPIQRLDDSDMWPSISVILRILFALSFENLLHVQQYLPELFHIIVLVFSTGGSDIRALTHGLLINVVHSLYTIKATADDKLQSLRFHLSEFNQPQFKLHFGIGGQNVTPFSRPNPNEKKLDKLPITTVETVADALLSVLSAVSPMGDPVGTTWHSRWLSLTTATAFRGNLALQPRACVTLGILCKSPALVTDDVMEYVVTGLKEALRNTTHDREDDLAVSLIICLTHLYPYLPSTSPYFRILFWVSISIVQISDTKLFSAAMSFLEVILRVQEENEGFKKGIEPLYMGIREGAVDQILSKLEQVSGMSFKTSFSFGIAGNLLKGLKFPKTKESTSKVLAAFLDISAKSNSLGTSMLGYLAALLPVEGDLPLIRDLVASARSPHEYFYTEQLLPDAKHAALLFTFLVTILENTDKTHEQLFIYDSLKEGIKFMPDAFHVIESILVPMMTTVLEKGQNPAIIDSAHSIMQTHFTYKQQNPVPKLNRTFLSEIGYHKLPECASFNAEADQKKEITKLVILLLENIMKEIKSGKGFSN